MSADRERPSIGLTDLPKDFLDPTQKDFIHALDTSTAFTRTKALSQKDLDFKSYYAQLETQILIHLDHLDGIKSSIVLDPEKTKYPTGAAFYRDATQAKPLNQRLKPGDRIIESQNLLLRALNTMRGIDHVLATREANEGRQQLLENFNLLIKNIIDGKDLIEAHEIFNTGLIRVLNDHKLNKGIKSVKKYSDLLVHYRDLANTIEPAKSVVTVTREERANAEGRAQDIIHTEQSDPITVKTEKQRQQIAAMKTVGESKDVNFHSAKKEAFQIADAAFADLIALDDRRLPAQSRKTIGPTAKNAYQNKYSIAVKRKKIKGDHEEEAKTRTHENLSLRSGSLVYVGDGATEAQLHEYTAEILKQLQAAAVKAGKPVLHLDLLVSDQSSEHQDLMLKITKAEAAEAKALLSHAPTNAVGLTQSITVAPELKQRADQARVVFDTSRMGPVHKNKRILNAAGIYVFASEIPNCMNVVICASGQDRTGTLLETAEQLWAVKVYAAEKITVTRLDIELIRSLGGHTAFMGSFSSPGSPGLKKDSHAWFLFSDLVNTFQYRKSANTNKHTPINVKAVEAVLQTPLIVSTKKAAPKEAKGVTLNDLMSVTAIVRNMINTYHSSGKKHSTQLSKFGDAVTAILDQEASPEAKLRQIIDYARKIWIAGVTKYAPKNKSGRNDNDFLVDLINREDADHSTLRQVGYLLQSLRTTYPSLNIPPVSDKGLVIIPHVANFKDVSTEQYNLLQQQLAECADLLKPKGNETLAQISKDLAESKDKDRDEAFTRAATGLNKLWIKFAKKQAGLFSMENTYKKSENLLEKINSSTPPDKYLTQRLVATMLNNIREQFGDVLKPPVSQLKQPVQFKASAVKASSAPGLTKFPKDEKA